MTPILFLAVALLAAPAPPPQSPAYTALLEGRMVDAARLAADHPPLDAEAHLILCRVDYAQGVTDAAVDQCQQAARAMPNNSVVQLWLGRALGQKAAHASALSAFGIARHVRDAFEAAVRLDPANRDAAADLGEFYVAAPGIVGGGTDKATRLAGSVATRFPSLSDRLLALVAQKNGDLTAAEAHFKAAIATTHAPDAFIDLANFYSTHNHPDEAVDTVRKAIAADPSHGPALVDAASILAESNREPALAEQCLRSYLQSSAQSDAAPTFKAHLALGRLLAKDGNAAAAHAEYVTAAALAPQYAPAQKALGSR